MTGASNTTRSSQESGCRRPCCRVGWPTSQPADSEELAPSSNSSSHPGSQYLQMFPQTPSFSCSHVAGELKLEGFKENTKSRVRKSVLPCHLPPPHADCVQLSCTHSISFPSNKGQEGCRCGLVPCLPALSGISLPHLPV